MAVIFKTNEFVSYSHQMKLVNPTNITSEIYKYAVEVLEKGYRNNPIRLIGIRVADLTSESNYQISLFDTDDAIDNSKIQKVLDNIADKYGDSVIIPASMKVSEEDE